MRKLIEDVMYGRRTDALLFPLRCFLGMLSVPYSLYISLRNLLYDRGILVVRCVPSRVVSIGNIVAGGTGKTPLVIMTAGLLKNDGYSVAVVSRGYGRTGTHPVVVSDGVQTFVTLSEAGDEPLIIAGNLPGVPVVVGKDRYAAANLAYERFRPDVIVLDDAFQHRRLNRSVDIVALDADNPYGGGHLLPYGLLREPPTSLKRATAVVITRVRDNHDHELLKRMVASYNPSATVFLSVVRPVSLRIPGTSDNGDVDMLRGKKAAALSNIAYPAPFHRLIGSLGAELVHKSVFPDHHRYEPEELERVEREAMEAGARILVMTAKDERNLPVGYNVKLIETHVLDIETVLVGDTDIFKCMIES